MKLMTEEIEKKLIKMGSQEDKNPKIIVKFFCPWNQWTWYVLEGEKLPGGDWRFFGLVDGLEKELGYFTLEELESLRKGNYPNGPKVERDKWFGYDHRLNEFKK
jgi:hypothetical protein